VFDLGQTTQIAHEENMVQSSIAYVQCALLYTSSDGERRIRWEGGCGINGHKAAESTQGCYLKPLLNNPQKQAIVVGGRVFGFLPSELWLYDVEPLLQLTMFLTSFLLP
jgi:hypothetical protein